MSYTFDDLLDILKPLIKEATKMELEWVGEAPKKSQKMSHFGGDPYFEMFDEWPRSEDGFPHDFICQIYNDKKLALPDDIKLVQFFYNYRQKPWSAKDDGWLIKVHKTINFKNMKKIDRPLELGPGRFCGISFQKIKTLPDWDTIDRYNEEATDIAVELNEGQPWDAYHQACAKLEAFHDLHSQVGGHPHFLQGDGTPTNDEGKEYQLLLQIDSEDEAGLMWSDMGLVYLFYDPDSGDTSFKLQCM